MAYFIGILLYVTGAGMFVLMLVQHMRGVHPILSLRNFALLGLIIYQFYSSAKSLVSGDHGDFHLLSPGMTSLTFAAMLFTFMLVFGWFYRRGKGVDAVVQRIPVPTYAPRAGSLLVLALLLTVLGIGMRFGVQVPLIGIIADKWGLAFAAMACGLVGWVWARNLVNPLMIVFMSAIVSANVFNALWGTFGRRPLVALGAAMILAMFYSHWRTLPVRKMLARFAVFGAVPVIFIGLYTAAREAQEFDRTAAEQLREMATADLGEGVLDLFSGQSCGPVSMWLIEAYPDRYEYKHLMALRYLVLMPVPRSWWEDKPKPLSTTIAHDASLSGVNDDILTIGPGIVGHAAAEGGWYALLIYAFVAAFILRVGDELIWRNDNNPLVILAVGAALGDCIGLSRGESSAFMFNFLVGGFGALLFVFVAYRFFRPDPSTLRSIDNAPDEAAMDDAALDVASIGR
jgi:hypothetical protein